MYDELVKALRICEVGEHCDLCPKWEDKQNGGMNVCQTAICKEAADAIEELSRKVEDYETRLELTPEAQYAIDKHAADLIDQMDKLIECLDEKPRWISVEERLPDARKEVYVTDGEYIARANLLDEVFPGDQPCWSYSGLGEITHWCEKIPLPEPPKEE